MTLATFPSTFSLLVIGVIDFLIMSAPHNYIAPNVTWKRIATEDIKVMQISQTPSMNYDGPTWAIVLLLLKNIVSLQNISTNWSFPTPNMRVKYRGRIGYRGILRTQYFCCITTAEMFSEYSRSIPRNPNVFLRWHATYLQSLPLPDIINCSICETRISRQTTADQHTDKTRLYSPVDALDQYFSSVHVCGELELEVYTSQSIAAAIVGQYRVMSKATVKETPHVSRCLPLG